MNQPGFQRDVFAAPERLAATLDAYAGRGALGDVPLRQSVILVGMGSSRFAAIPEVARLRAAGLDAACELASTGLPTAPRSGLLAVGISASGTTPEAVEALTRHHGIGPTVAITNDPASALAAVADVVLPLHAGAEEGEVSCLTFPSTLAVLRLLGDRLLGKTPDVGSLRPAVEAAAALRDGRDAWLPGIVDLVDAARFVSVAAPAQRLSTALQGALMLREGPRVTADGTETGDWLHVDLYLTKRPGYVLLLSTGSLFDGEAARWCRERETPLVAIGEPLDGAAAHVPIPDDPVTRLLVESGVADLVAAETWRRRLAAGDAALV